jgi:adenine/guanine phosphoribosyltransferase-like PRPP-binding protein
VKPVKAVWTGSWVSGRLGLELLDRGDDTAGGDSAAPAAPRLADLVGLALRRNPKRAHLLVSRVLGKHVPTDPRLVYGAGRLLGALVADALAGTDRARGGWPLLQAAIARPDEAGALLDLCTALGPAPERPLDRSLGGGGAPLAVPVVLGYAETATALGHAVADQLGADCLHSTRRPVQGVTAPVAFEEEHSHATAHLLLPADPHLLARDTPLVLVDDELSTGRTALNTIRALHAHHRRSRYLVAALVDLRDEGDRAAFAETARTLGVRIEVIALATGRLEVPATAAGRAARLAARQDAADEQRLGAVGQAFRTPSHWPLSVREGARHGFSPADRGRAEQAAATAAAEIAGRVSGDRVLVLGSEELMYAPLLIALALQGQLAGRTVLFSSTTRSPVLPIDDPGYAIRTRLSFDSHDDPADGPGPRFAYNVDPGADLSARFSDIVLVIDRRADTDELFAPGGLVGRLAAVCDQLQVVTLPVHRPARSPAGRPLPTPLFGPAFGSYPAEDVAWLLSDLSTVRLEAPIEEREEAIQSGGGHYAESLPIEYQPSVEYQHLFASALAESATRVAVAVGVVTELVLHSRGDRAVLVSLARAGTPVGVLMRRWAAWAHGLELPHYTMSIVRGRGIDTVALDYLAGQHDPAQVMFVDGWTGKGAITAELTAAVERANALLGTAFSPELAVLADTGSCVSIFGTREDYLIPSACLNSTVSGLVSRTVLNDALIGPGDFHGAKFYAELAGADVSQDFIEAIAAQFDAVGAAVQASVPALLAADREPTWSGWRAVEELSEEYGIFDVNLVKPGVGETTRVLLRRVPWKVVMRADAVAGLGHVRMLAAQRGVEVVVVEELAYSCVGLIHPRFTRGAVGGDGRSPRVPATAGDDPPAPRGGRA